MNNERASLKMILEYQEAPPAKVWDIIAEEIDREQLSRILYTHTENPLADSWKKTKPSPRIGFRWAVAASILAGITCGIVYLFYSNSPLVSDDRIASIPNPNTTVINEARTESPLNLKQSDEPLPVARIDRKTKSPLQIEQAVNGRDEKKYLLVATESGKPIRVPVKWSGLSCCLSGESETLECRAQQNGWHAELATSRLGFQADPILGLMELMDASDR